MSWVTEKTVEEHTLKCLLLIAPSVWNSAQAPKCKDKVSKFSERFTMGPTSGSQRQSKLHCPVQKVSMAELWVFLVILFFKIHILQLCAFDFFQFL